MKKSLLSAVLLLYGYLLPAQSLSNRSPDDGWKLFYGPAGKDAPSCPDDLLKLDWPWIPTLVPGNVELDLLASGVIKNPETGNNIYSLRKYEAYQWWYTRTFKTPVTKSDEKIEIVFHGIDCFGTVWINNRLIGQTDNMFTDHRFDVTESLNPGGSNTIFICINPAVAEGRKYINGVIGTRSDFSPEGVNVRKAPHMYGWDIMPRLVSAGLWRDVCLEIVRPERFRQVYWMTNRVDTESRKAELILDWEIESELPVIDGLTLEFTLSRNSKIVCSGTTPLITYCGRQRISLDSVDFWWPRGYGNASLYDGTVRILDTGGKILAEENSKVGIRTAELIHSDVASEDGSGEFVFLINGEKIFVRGTNWVPLDALHSRDKSHLRDAFSMITDLNCNMIRCWGGNVYEDDDFFGLCDENGIMVWQDFAMGCTTYPQNNDFVERIRTEAISVVLKLRGHPSLVLWSGNNEDDASLEWTFVKHIDPGRDRISREILPKVIWEFDPLRTYLSSSPYASEEYFRRGDDPGLLPEVHLWGPRGYYKAPFYTKVNAHFVSEIGYHGCPSRKSLEQMFDPVYVYPWKNDGSWNDEWQTKAVRAHPEFSTMDKRNDLMIKQVKSLFGDCPKDLDTFIFASQAVQAEAMKFFIEFWRMDKFRKTGIIWWNLRDGWPIISDAIVDFYNRKKLAYYYIRQVQTNICVMIGDTSDGSHPVVAVNDTREAVSGDVTVKDGDSGKKLFTSKFSVAPNSKNVIGFLQETNNQSMWLVEYSLGKDKFTNHYLNGTAPFKLEDYVRWYKKLNIARE
jgi:beta-mannosidase